MHWDLVLLNCVEICIVLDELFFVVVVNGDFDECAEATSIGQIK